MKQRNIKIGLKLFAAGALVLMASASQNPLLWMFLAGLVLIVPTSFAERAGKLYAGDPDDEEEEEGSNEETKTLLKKVRAAAKKEVTQYVKAINEDGEKKIEAIINKKMEIFKDVPIDKLKKAVDEMEAANAAIAELKAKQANHEETKKETFFQQKLKENFEGFKKAASDKGSFSFKLETKAPDLVNAASFGDRVIFGFREAGVSFAALPELFILDLIQVMTGGPGSNPLSWIERNVHTQAGPPAIVANPTGVAESAAKPQLGYQWVENKISAETIAAHVPITKQALTNYTMLDQEVRFELMRRLAAVLQTQIINGTGVSPQLKGINTYAQTFAAGAFAATINFANEFDVLVAAATQILNQNYVPTVALVSHTAKGRMSMAKDSTGSYVLPPFVAQGGLQVYGLRVIGTTEMTAEQFIVMDPTKSLFNWVENITIEVGYINDDFTKNQFRLRGELQGMHRIKEHEKLAFVKGAFDTAKAALETP